VQIEDDIVTTVLLPLYSANLNCRALAALLPEGTTKCYAYLINRVYSCKEIFIDMSHASAVNVGADVNVDPVDVAAKVGWQKSASAQVRWVLRHCGSLSP
jgi:hypothetical protein